MSLLRGLCLTLMADSALLGRAGGGSYSCWNVRRQREGTALWAAPASRPSGAFLPAPGSPASPSPHKPHFIHPGERALFRASQKSFIMSMIKPGNS